MSTSIKDYDFGNQRIFYQAADFGVGITVTGLFFRPDGTSVETGTFTEHQDGIYSIIFKFDKYGKWGLLIYEGGTPASFATKRIGY